MIIDYKQLTGLKRIPLHLWNVPGFKEVGHKPYMTKEQVYELLTGLSYVRIDEKLDGKTSWNTIGGYDDSEIFMFYEDISQKHSIEYKRNGPKKIIFDIGMIKEEHGIENGSIKVKKVMNFEKSVLSAAEYLGLKDDEIIPHHWYYVPHSNSKEKNWEWIDEFITTDIPKILKEKSGFGSKKIEGIVIKNYEKQLFGKIVNPEFEDGIKENYIRRDRRRE